MSTKAQELASTPNQHSRSSSNSCLIKDESPKTDNGAWLMLTTKFLGEIFTEQLVIIILSCNIEAQWQGFAGKTEGNAFLHDS